MQEKEIGPNPANVFKLNLGKIKIQYSSLQSVGGTTTVPAVLMTLICSGQNDNIIAYYSIIGCYYMTQLRMKQKKMEGCVFELFYFYLR